MPIDPHQIRPYALNRHGKGRGLHREVHGAGIQHGSRQRVEDLKISYHFSFFTHLSVHFPQSTMPFFLPLPRNCYPQKVHETPSPAKPRAASQQPLISARSQLLHSNGDHDALCDRPRDCIDRNLCRSGCGGSCANCLLRRCGRRATGNRRRCYYQYESKERSACED